VTITPLGHRSWASRRVADGVVHDASSRWQAGPRWGDCRVLGGSVLDGSAQRTPPRPAGSVALRSASAGPSILRWSPDEAFRVRVRIGRALGSEHDAGSRVPEL